MKLVDMTASKFADDDPTLVFYVDVPSEMISLMLSTLMNLISQVADSDDLIQYRIVTFQVQVMGGGANVVRQGRMVEE